MNTMSTFKTEKQAFTFLEQLASEYGVPNLLPRRIAFYTTLGRSDDDSSCLVAGICFFKNGYAEIALRKDQRDYDTLIHEFAHAIVLAGYNQLKQDPHGELFRSIYQDLIDIAQTM